MAANIKLQSLTQFARLGCNVGIRCRCGRVTTIDPERLIAFARRKGIAIDRPDLVRDKLRCTVCGAKGQCRIGWSWDRPSDDATPAPARSRQFPQAR